MRFGCCLNLGPFTPNMADGKKGAPTLGAVTKAMDFLADVGFDFVEYPVKMVVNPPGGDFSALVAAVRSTPIPVFSFNIFIPPELPLVGPSRNLSQLRNFVQQACACISQLGGRIIVFGSGTARRVPDGYALDQAHREIVEFLRLAGDIAAQSGITIVIEPLNKKETNIINTVAEGLALSELVNNANVRTLADIYHMNMEEEEPDILVGVGSRLAHVHVADTDRSAPGTGEYDFRRMSQCLKRGGYQGDIAIECRWKDFLHEAPLALATLRQAWLD